jgi:hypothetical protein
MKIGELFVKLGFEANTPAVVNFSEKITALSTGFLALRQILQDVTNAVSQFVGETISGVVALTNFNQQTGLMAENLQKLQVAGQLSDLTLSAEQITSSIQALQQSLTQIRLGGGNIAPFQLLGISALDTDPFEVIDQLREKIKGLDSAVAVNLIQQMGLSPQFINLLRLSRDEFKALSDEPFLGAGQRQEVLKLGTTLTALQIKLKVLSDQLNARLAPIFLKIIKPLVEYLKNNTDRAFEFFDNMADGVNSAASALSNLSKFTSSIIAFIDKILGFERFILIISSLGAAFFLLANPIMGVVVGVIVDMIGKLGDIIHKKLIKPIDDLLEKFLKIKNMIPTLPEIGGRVNLVGIGGGLTPTLQPATVNQSNTFNVSGNTAEPDDIVRALQPHLNSVNLQLNNGGK